LPLEIVPGLRKQRNNNKKNSDTVKIGPNGHANDK
jgi:hypothetical protein